MNKLLWSFLGILFLAGGIFGIVMLVMAAIFMEYGRVVFYMAIAFICLPLAVDSFLKLKDPKS